jgi:hypothetical protein
MGSPLTRDRCLRNRFIDEHRSAPLGYPAIHQILSHLAV